jgi:hypothetical protein
VTAIDPTVPPRIYKYVTPDRIDVLESLTIRFTQPSAANDPFELTPLFNRAIPREQLEQVLSSFDKLVEQIDNLDKCFQRIKVIDPNSQPKPFPEDLKLAYTKLKVASALKRSQIVSWDRTRASQAKVKLSDMLATIGILSFSSSPSNSVLWAHYAGGGKGFVYEFDTSSAFFSSCDGPLQCVRYVDRNPENRTIRDINIDDLFFTKAKQWAYEEEWRLVAPLEQSKTKFIVEKGEIYLFDILPSALMRVIVGANTSNDLVAKITSTIHSRQELSHIEMARIHVNLESHCLDVVPLSG